MGFFTNLFGSANPQEQSLIEVYTISFRALGMQYQEARETATKMLEQAKQAVVASGMSNEPPNMGDVLLNQENSNPQIKHSLAIIRSDGATTDDIRWWWNMSPLEREMIKKADDMNRMTAFTTAMTQGCDGATAAKKVFAIHPKFGDPSSGEGEDRPLTIALKRRIIEWQERHHSTPGVMNEKCEQASSFNALIRSEIHAGNL